MPKMKAKCWFIPNYVDKPVDKLVTSQQIQEAARWLRQGEVVAFPTETVYGLGANAFDEQAVQRIFEVKGRPNDNPLIVHVSRLEDVEKIVDEIPEQAQCLMDRFWPGPLSLVLPQAKAVCPGVTAGLSTVAVRMPDHPLALALIQAAQTPLAAPSANRSGKPSPTSAEHVLQDLGESIVGVLDGGPTGVGLESTVVDLSGAEPMILRPGSITQEALEDVLGPVRTDPALEDMDFKPKSPGVKYQHYAPQGELWLVSDEHGLSAMRQFIIQKVTAEQHNGYKTGIITTAEGRPIYASAFGGTGGHAPLVLSLGRRADPARMARRLYAVLRQFDQAGIERIYAETFPATGVGAALMNRLLKAAAYRVIR